MLKPAILSLESFVTRRKFPLRRPTPYAGPPSGCRSSVTWLHVLGGHGCVRDTVLFTAQMVAPTVHGHSFVSSVTASCVSGVTVKTDGFSVSSRPCGIWSGDLPYLT